MEAERKRAIKEQKRKEEERKRKEEEERLRKEEEEQFRREEERLKREEEATEARKLADEELRRNTPITRRTTRPDSVEIALSALDNTLEEEMARLSRWSRDYSTLEFPHTLKLGDDHEEEEEEDLRVGIDTPTAVRGYRELEGEQGDTLGAVSRISLEEAFGCGSDSVT